MKNLTAITIFSISLLFFSCGDNSSNNTKASSDSVHSGLEGTREDASQLSNATIDTSAGQSAKKTPENSKDTLRK